MRVLVTTDTVGGVWTYTRELVTGLVRRGVDVTLVSFGNIPTPQQLAWTEGLRTLDFRPTAFRLEWMQEAEQDIGLSRDYLLSVIRETSPDLLHLNQYCYGSLPVAIPKLVVAHSDVVSWWVSVKGEYPVSVPWMSWYREVVHQGLESATMVVAPSKWMFNQIATWYAQPRHGKVIYNGRSPLLFNPYLSKDSYALSVGRIWDSGKQVSLLANIQAPVPIFIVGAEEHADATLRGNGTLTESGSHLQIKGPQSEAQLRQWFSRASTYVACSRYEPFGLAPLEAAFSRCVVLANDIPSFREIWGDAACYFRQNDSYSVEEQLTKLHEDRSMRLTFANLAYRRARERYTADRMVDEYMGVYSALLNVGAIAA